MRGTFLENNQIRLVGSPATWAAAACYTDWTDTTGFRRTTFLCGNGELDGDMSIKVYEATSAAGANAQEVDTGLRSTFTNGTDEDTVGGIEVLAEDLTTGYPYVALLVTPSATDSFCCIAVLSEPYGTEIIDNDTGVAFTTSL